MRKILVLLSLCVLLSPSESLSNERVAGQTSKELILKNKLRPKDKNFLGLLLVPCTLLISICKIVSMKWDKKSFRRVTNIFETFAEGSFYSILTHIDQGIFFPFVPIEEWCPKTTMPTTKITEKTTMRDRPTPAETKETEPTTETTTVTTTKATATTLPPVTTTTEATTIVTTTTPDISVVTFDPNQPITPLCNCSLPNPVKALANVTTVKIEKNVNTTPSSTSTTTATQSTHVKIDVKNVISLIDIILSYLNLTRSNQ